MLTRTERSRKKDKTNRYVITKKENEKKHCK